MPSNSLMSPSESCRQPGIMRCPPWFRQIDDAATLHVTYKTYGDFTVQALEEANLVCPHCGEPITLLLDLSGGAQSYTEDCQVCCQPIHVSLWIDDAGDDYHVDLRREQD